MMGKVREDIEKQNEGQPFPAAYASLSRALGVVCLVACRGLEVASCMDGELRHAYVLSSRVVLFVRAQGLYVPPGCQHSPREAEPLAMPSAMVQKGPLVE